MISGAGARHHALLDASLTKYIAAKYELDHSVGGGNKTHADEDYKQRAHRAFVLPHDSGSIIKQQRISYVTQHQAQFIAIRGSKHSPYSNKKQCCKKSCINRGIPQSRLLFQEVPE